MEPAVVERELILGEILRTAVSYVDSLCLDLLYEQKRQKLDDFTRAVAAYKKHGKA